jgi:hypothetical protein
MSAQAVGEELERIRHQHGGDIPTLAVIEAARPPDSPLHPGFTWDVEQAARERWTDQARNIIRSVVRHRMPTDAPEAPRIIQCYVAIGDRDVGSRFTTTARALSEPDLRQRVLRDAIAQLSGWRERFGHLQELSRVINAIDDDLAQLA